MKTTKQTMANNKKQLHKEAGKSLLAMGTKKKEQKKLTGIEISIQEVKEGKVNKYPNSDELFKHLGM